MKKRISQKDNQKNMNQESMNRETSPIEQNYTQSKNISNPQHKSSIWSLPINYERGT